jgi:cyclase
MKRKLAIAGGIVLGLALVVAVWAWVRVGRIDADRLGRDVYMMTGVGGNVTLVTTGAGAVVVDTMTFVRQGAAIRERIAAITSEPVAAIINTHYHLDHTHGNPAFVPGTKVVATEQTLEHLHVLDAAFWRDMPARDLIPSTTFTDTHELHVGGKTIRAFHFGRGHTDGDLVVLFVEDRTLAAGDLFFNGHFPSIDLEAGGSVAEWAATLDKVLALDFDTVVPGHGPVSTREGLRGFRDFMATLWTETSRIAERGGSLDDALASVDLERFALRPLIFAPYLNRTSVIRRAFEEATTRRRPG